MMAAIMGHAWFAQLDEERDGPRLGYLLVGLTLIGCAAAIVVGAIGPHL